MAKGDWEQVISVTPENWHVYIYICVCVCVCSVAQQPKWDLGRLIFGVSRSYTIRHTHGMTPLNEWSARRRGRHLHNKHTRRTSVFSEGFEPATQAIERPQTYALDRTASGIDKHIWKFCKSTLLLPSGCLYCFSSNRRLIDNDWDNSSTYTEYNTNQHTDSLWISIWQAYASPQFGTAVKPCNYILKAPGAV
jgi:hypothetical protein